MLDCDMFGLNAVGHHAVSIFLHGLNSVLVFWGFYQLTGRLTRSFVLAAIFGLHPLRIESVAWIAERKDVLSMTFWLLTLIAYVRYVRTDKSRSFFYSFSVVFFALGLMSKAMLVTLPFVLLLLDYWPLSRFQTKGAAALVIEKIPFLVAAFAASLITFLIQEHAGAMAAGLPFSARMGNAVISYCEYLRTFFYPLKLAIFYPHSGHVPASSIVLSGALLLGGTAGAYSLRKSHPYLLVGWLWFLGTLVPVIGLVQVGSQARADRYTYIPILGFQLCLVWGVCDLAARIPKFKWAAAVSSAIILTLCVVLTRQQLAFWKNNETLFRRALAVTEKNHMAHFCLGICLAEKGDLMGAKNEYLNALAVNPNFADARTGLGNILVQQGDAKAAAEEFQRALQLRPNYSAGEYGLAMALEQMGQSEAAILHYQAALKSRLKFPDAHFRLGGLLYRMGRVNEAISHYQESLAQKPDSAAAHNELGVALARLGRIDDAILHYQEAVRLQPDSSFIRYNFGNALMRAKRNDQAIAELSEAVRLQPDHAEAHNNLGIALTNKRRFNEAAEQFEYALKVKPDYEEARQNLATVNRIKNTGGNNQR